MAAVRLARSAHAIRWSAISRLPSILLAPSFRELQDVAASPAIPPIATSVGSCYRNLSSAPHPLSFAIYNTQRQRVTLNHMAPDVAVDAWVAPNAVLVGGVRVHDGSSVWYGSVLRADLNYITVGAGSSIGERVVVSTISPAAAGDFTEVVIGRHVTVGPRTVLESCEIEDEAIIGQGCVVPARCLIETQSILDDGSVLSSGQLVPSGELWAGNPARFVRKLSADEKAAIAGVAQASKYTSEEHAAEFLPFSTAYIQKEKLMQTLKGIMASKTKQ